MNVNQITTKMTYLVQGQVGEAKATEMFAYCSVCPYRCRDLSFWIFSVFA